MGKNTDENIISETAAEGPEQARPHPEDSAADGREPVVIFRPAARSAWFLFVGLLLGPAVIFFNRDPDGHPAKWIALSLLALGLILHRLSLKYTLTGSRIKASAWWGLKPEESLTLAYIAEVGVFGGFVGRLVGCGHVEIKSAAVDEAGLVLLGQPEPLTVAAAIEEAAARARKRTEDDEQRRLL